MYDVACIVDAGTGCHGNDDRILIGQCKIQDGYYEKTQTNRVLAVVCDGVGGEAFGDEAAEIAISQFYKMYLHDITIDTINQNVKAASLLIQAAQKQDPAHARMSSTVAGIYIVGNSLIAFNVGDSRVYRYRPPYIAQLSTDHTVIAEFKSMGIKPIPGQEHVITKFLGGENHTPDIFDGTDKALEGDSYIVCSDGISDVFSDNDLAEIMQQELSLHDLCTKMIEEAVARGSQDNLSFIIIRRK